MNVDTSFGAFQVEQKDKDGKTIRLYWRRYMNEQHRNAAKRKRRRLRSERQQTTSAPSPWKGKRKRAFRLKANNHCPCGATWPEDEMINGKPSVRAGKVKKFKKCCRP